jgi:PAS domain S-box-containing protein
MPKSSNLKNRWTVMRNYLWAILSLWTVFVGLVLLWSLFQQKLETLKAARVQARSAFEKDLVYRRWAAMHGGIYVPVTEQTPPNPHLASIDERDITTPAGRRLTLMNPAYMTRQAHEIGAKQYGLRGHITSLNPIRPANAADAWETEALRAFEQGANEVSSVEKLDNKAYMRLMCPLVTEQSCLKCHAEQGYKVGDLRGGISVSVPMAPLRAVARGHMATLALGHIMIWLLGLVGISFWGRNARHSIRERDRAEETLKRSEERYALAQQAANIGSWDWNILTNKLAWSEQIEPMFGFNRDKFEGTYEAFLECIHPEDRQSVIDSVNASVKWSKDYKIEHRIIWPDGTVRWVSEKGNVIRDENDKAIRMLGIVQDITERKQAEQQIENLAKFPSENPNPVLRITKEGTVLYANAAGCELLKTWECTVGEQTPEHWHQYILRILKSGSSEELEVKCGDRVFSLVMAPVPDASYANLYGIDITERKLVEEDLGKYRQRLEELVETRTAELTQTNIQLMEEIEVRKLLEKEILNISEQERRKIGQELHDSLGQQLTGVAFMAKVLEQKLAKKSLDEAVDATKIATLVNQATEQARGLARGLHPVDLDTRTLTSALQELATSTETLFGIHCVFKCDKPIEVDNTEVAVHLYRIAQEALTNAIKHGKAKNIQIGLTCSRNKYVLTIRNDGLDFPKEFEARGTGMGLQIMDHRVDIIGGSLDIHKAAEGGTIVTCTFPNKKHLQ